MEAHMANEIIKDTVTTKSNKHTDDEKLKAAYALNMCTVSVSQIVDYHDSYILEQEYDAILNNLNLKEMPKDEALLRIITELLNTITFFRIQEKKKQQIEKKYNQRIKNAIWSAVPSLSVVVSGNPVAIAMSLATQIGTGYMNYRKEKNNAGFDREDAELELEITAIEQLNALKRELFTTAWRLADEYDFNDEWRITEKQIKQYNAILMDSDEIRKYQRLEAIANRFVAYPPFWYFYGHAANYISEMAKDRMASNDQDTEEAISSYKKDEALVETYSNLAKEHYEHYYKLCKNNILREDQITASFALEYADLLKIEENPDNKKIKELIKLAEKMSPTSFDVLQLCVIAYLKIGETEDASRLLKILVNEEYNTSTNAKLLSRIYVSQYLFGKAREQKKALAGYQLLEETTDSANLFPMPIANSGCASDVADKEMEEQFIETQKNSLKRDYRIVINEFIKAGIVKYNNLWPVPCTADNVDDSYFDNTDEAKRKRLKDVEHAFDENDQQYMFALRDSVVRVRYLDLLNDVLRSLDELSLFRHYEDKDYLIRKIKKQIVNVRIELKEYQEKLEKGSLSFEDYLKMQGELSFRLFTEEFFNAFRAAIVEQIDDAENVSKTLGETTLRYLETAELELIEFCHNNSLAEPDSYRNIDNVAIDVMDSNCYFDYSILGEDVIKETTRKEIRDKTVQTITENIESLCTEGSIDTAILLPNTDEFETYFKNVKLGGAGLKPNVLAIIDDKTRKDKDLLLTYRGIVVVIKNKIQPVIAYENIKYSKSGNKDELDIGWPDTYFNKDINIAGLYNIIEKLSEIQEMA